MDQGYYDGLVVHLEVVFRLLLRPVMRFRFVPKSMTLDDVERPKDALLRERRRQKACNVSETVHARYDEAYQACDGLIGRQGNHRFNVK